MFIPPQGVRILATAADVEALLTQVMGKQMSGNTALVSLSRGRQATDGRKLERLGETYTLRRTEGGWKIAVVMIHDPDTILRSA